LKNTDLDTSTTTSPSGYVGRLRLTDTDDETWFWRQYTMAIIVFVIGASKFSMKVRGQGCWSVLLLFLSTFYTHKDFGMAKQWQFT
jgi:hypothetical protein